MSSEKNSRAPSDLLEKHGDYLFRFAIIRLKNHHLAEEIVQETLVKAFKNYSSFRGDSSVRTWLVQILRNEISGYFRSVKKEKKFREDTEAGKTLDLATLLEPNVSSQQFQSETEKQEFWVTIRECFSKLPDHLLEAFVARLENDGKKTEEICKDLGITPSNFSVRMFRARIMLRKCLESVWFENS